MPAIAAPLDRPIICPILVGRIAQYEALAHLLAQAHAGGGHTALIAGEAGIGKSRLAAETKTRATQEGFQVLQGRCFETDRAFPYAPLLDLLRTYFAARSADEIRRELGAVAAELIALLPELSAIPPAGAATAALGPEQKQRRLFQGLLQFLKRLPAPLLIVVEDLHWSDDTSLEFLLFLARQIANQPILLLLTYRSDEVHPALSAFLADLDRERRSTDLALSRLTAEEVKTLIGAIFDLRRPVHADFLAALYALTEGNPFFIEEVLKSLIAAGEIFYTDGAWDRKPLNELHIPRSVLVAVQRRLDQLSPDAREALTLAAVAGRRFDFALLQELTRRDEAALVRLVKELIRAQLVVEESADTCAFRHALTQQAVASDLLARERRALHHAIAEALERVYPEALDSRLADLAYHFDAAEIWDRALEYARRAGDQARELYAPRAAVEQFTRAINAARRMVRDPEPDLYRARGRMQEMLGEFDAARADYEQALAAARAAHDGLGQWHSLFDLGFLWTGRDYERAGVYLQQALEAARAMQDRSIRAHSLNRVGNWYVNGEQPHDGQRYHQEALSIFQELNDRHGLAETFDLLAGAAHLGGDLAQGMAHYEQAAVIFRALNDPMGLVSSLTWLTFRGATYLNTMVATAPLMACVRTGEEALRIAREINWRVGEALAMIALGICLGAQGDYGRAVALAHGGLEIAEEIGHTQWLSAARVALGGLYLDLLALPIARHHLEQGLAIAQQSNVLFSIRLQTSMLTLTCLGQHELARAESLLEAAIGPVGSALTDAEVVPTMAQRLCWYARAELALKRGAPAEALQIADRLITSAGPSEQIVACLPRFRGETLAALKQADEAEAALLTAQQAASAQGARPQLWRIHAALARLYQSQSRRAEASDSSAAARGIVDELAAHIPDAELRDGFLQGALALIPRATPLTPRRAAKQAFGGLTEREREVASMIAQGRSNREISDALVLSERTTKAHVGNILGKLGFTSRTQIVAWAIETGLVKRRSS
jgi:DNA-binding NarL/FixJ family response regulator